MGAGMGQVWNFPVIHSVASTVQTQSAQISALQAEVKGVLARLSSVWGGSANEAYTAVQLRWDTRAEDTNTALASLANSFHSAAEEMARTEAQQTAVWA